MLNQLQTYKGGTMNWNEVFEYRDGELIMKINIGRNRSGNKSSRHNSKGWQFLYITGKYYSIPRIIWEMHYGKIPAGMKITYKDKNPGNTLIENLELVTESILQQHNPDKSNNSSGVTGVSLNSRLQKWEASIMVNGQRYKSYFEAFEDAVLARKKFEELYRDPSPYKEIS